MMKTKTTSLTDESADLVEQIAAHIRSSDAAVIRTCVEEHAHKLADRYGVYGEGRKNGKRKAA